MPLGGGHAYLSTLIGEPSSNLFRRLEIRRRQASDGKFESSWQDISQYVKRWGTIQAQIDDVRLNRFSHAGPNVVVNNDLGKFNVQSNLNSLWYGYLTRYRSLVRYQAGYEDADGNEFPTDPTLGVFLINDEIGIRSDSNDVLLRLSSLQTIFNEIRARDIIGLGATLTASEIITKIRDHTDGSGNFIFQEFISTGAWTIQTTTSYYRLDTVTSLDDLTAWDLMEKLGEAEGYVPLITRTGGFDFRSRAARQSTTAFTLYGQDFPRPNVIAIQDYKEAYNKYFNFFRLKYLQADTSTSYVQAGTTTSVNPTNPSWLFGQRVYELENTFVSDTATAQSLVNAMYTTFGTMTSEATFKTVLIPHLEILDRIDAYFHAYDLGNSTIWDTFNWDEANWSVEGENFDWDAKNFVLLSRQINLDDMTCVFKAREA